MSILPIPTDTIVGMFHPWRDFFGNLPFKNFILTDPVRQQYPWRELAVDLLKKLELPLWNPYNFAGTPLLANIQSAVFYPLNILFYLLSFPHAWSIYILAAPVLAAFFMYLYLRNLNLNKLPALFGSLTFALCGFNIAWLENGVLTHTLLWLPLILWSMDRRKSLVFLFAMFSSFTAGHWQTFFYVFLFSHVYLFLRSRRSLLRFFILDAIFLVLALPQLLPSLQFIGLSGRSQDQLWQNVAGWFIPWQNLVQFIAPDFFGNPATLNYRGIFSYQEFVGYLGIPAFVFAISAIFIKRKIVWFFLGTVVVGLIFALPTPLAKLPFALNLPLISSSMPTRLLSIIDFSLAVLAAFGFQKFNKKLFAIFLFFFALLGVLSPSRYLLLPFALLIATFVLKKYSWLLIGLLLLDLGRFGFKYLPITDSKYLYPETKVTRFLQENTKDNYFRFMTLSDEIFPPNFNVIYRIQSVNGYDPLYLKAYSDLVGGGNRIIVPKDYKNPVFNELGVKYILSFEDISGPAYVLVMEEGKTKIFENKNVSPRAYLESGGEAKITLYSENVVIIKTSSMITTTLILSDMYYPGWKVSVDGVLSKITPTPYNFRSVELSPGDHEVIFKMSLL